MGGSREGQLLSQRDDVNEEAADAIKQLRDEAI
jgi:hypothetical protein